MMKQSDAIKLLYRDLQIVTSDLCFIDYDRIFEEEIQEYFPFSSDIMEWLSELYCSEKYSAFDEHKLSLYYEKDHPFLFIRDLAHINSWNLGFKTPERRDHITGLMFSSRSTYSLEATYALCRPSLIEEPASSWFDFKQTMTNLDKADPASWVEQAWKGCSLFYLYFNLSQDPETISRDELLELLEPYMRTFETAILEGDQKLRAECGVVTSLLRTQHNQTLFDGYRL